MQIDLNKVLQCEGNVLDIDCSISLDDLSYYGQKFSFTKPFHVVGKVTNLGPILELEAEVLCEFKTSCDRCLKEIVRNETFLVTENLVRDENHTTYEDVYIFHGYYLDLSDVVLKNFLLNTSLKYLCSEDCKGLCPVCGADLNVSPCSCNHEEIDPRLAVLKSFKGDK